MFIMKTIYGLALGIGLAVSPAFYGCSGCKKNSTPEAPAKEIVAPVKEATIPKKMYVVQKGDYLSKIAFNNGHRGKDLYKNVLLIQNLTWGPKEIYRRDTHKVEDGVLVPGKDGLADLIYPGEEIRLQ